MLEGVRSAGREDGGVVFIVDAEGLNVAERGKEGMGAAGGSEGNMLKG